MKDIDRTKFPANTDKRLGANFETGDYPGFGVGLLAYSQGQPISEGSRILRRGYPTFYPWGFTRGLEGAHSVAMNVMVEKDNRQPLNVISGPNWLSVLSLYGWKEGVPSLAEATATVNIVPSGERIRAMLYSINVGTQNPPTRAQLYRDAPYFEFGKKYRFEVVVDNDRNIRLYQTNLSDDPEHVSLVAKAQLSDKAALGLQGGHGGLYGNVEARIFNSDLVIKKIGR